MARQRHAYNTPVPAGYSTGLVLRNYAAFPVGCMAFAPAFPDSELIEEAAWPDLWADQKRQRASLLDMRQDNYEILRSLDQDGEPLCWAFSSTKATMYVRARMGQPLLRLSAWWVAGRVVNWQSRGYWGSASLAQIVKEGVPAESYCPSYRSSYDNQACRDNAALHRVTEWWDGSDNPTVAARQLVTSLLRAVPCVVDLNDMSHSMCAIAIGNLNPLEIIYDNSWGDGGENGLYRGRGARARPDGLVIPRVSLASP